jgi:VanZ family protein
MTHRHVLTVASILFALLVLYGSCMPWDLSSDQHLAARNFTRAKAFWPMGSLQPSRMDLLSNLLLYMPLGLLIAMRASLAEDHTPMTDLLLAVLAGAMLSLVIETIQLMSPTRVAGVHDLLMNTAGAAVGGAIGAARGREIWAALCRQLRWWWAEHPLRLAAVGLGVLLAADALYPFLPTLDVSTVWRSLKAVSLNPRAELADKPAIDWIVRALLWAVAVMVLAPAVSAPGRSRRSQAVAAAFLLMLALEAGKAFIEARTPSLAASAVSTVGIAVGAGLSLLLAGRFSPTGQRSWACIALVLYITYLAWQPFDFTLDRAVLEQSLPKGDQWLPLYHYAMRGRPADVFLFVRTLLLFGAWVAIRQINAPRPIRQYVLRGALAGLILGIILEAGQLLLPGRYATTTDLLCCLAGGALGGLLAKQYQTRPAGSAATDDGHHAGAK